ncbi:MAG: hypothetical protein LUF85_15705 [Bacteroides sp.]|nr:hypothetical protein [Bacteroides sp.]
MKIIKINVLIVVLVYASCSPGPGNMCNVLRQAEMFIHFHPDSALYILENIEYPERLTGRQQADYALLLTQTKDRMRYGFTSDSLISLAVTYYDQHPDLNRRGKAYFYSGRVKSELGKSEEAMEYFLKARQIFEHTDEYKFMGMIHEEIGWLNRNADLLDKAIMNYLSALSYHQLNQDTVSMCFAYDHLAFTYLLDNDVAHAQTYYEKALELLGDDDQHDKYPYLVQGLGLVFRKKGEDIKAAEYFDIAEQFYKGEDLSAFYLSRAKLFLSMDQIDDAKEYFHKCLNSSFDHTKMDACNYLYGIEKQLHNYKDALAYKEQYDSLYNSSQQRKHQKELLELQHVYEYEKWKQLKQCKLEKLVILILIGTCLLVGLIHKLIEYRKRLKDQRYIIHRLKQKIVEHEKHTKKMETEQMMNAEKNKRKIQEVI